MKDLKFLPGDGIVLTVVSKKNRALPPEVKAKLNAPGTHSEHVIIVEFNLMHEEAPSTGISRDQRKKNTFHSIKTDNRVTSQELWLGETERPDKLTAYLAGSEHSFMSMTQCGILTAETEEKIRQQYREMVDKSHHGRA